MTKEDYCFYDNQCLVPQVGYCTTNTDKKWEKAVLRRFQRRPENLQQKNFDFSSVAHISDPESNESDIDNDNDFQHQERKRRKGEKRKYIPVCEHSDDPLPSEYRHIRSSANKVKPNIYMVMEKLSSVYHMSARQVQGAITTIANDLFGRKEYGQWKTNEESQTIDVNTLPCQKSFRVTETCLEAMALGRIVDEIMDDTSDVTVVYSNDGSARSGVGSYVVQSLTINGVHRSLPTYGIFTESRDSLKELELSTLKILSASSGFKYTSEDIVKKINFVMTDSTEHNMGVIDEVCSELEVEKNHVPLTLVCNVHPLMMFQDKVKSLYQILHSSLGAQKISECFLVDIDFQNESFVIKAIKCLTNFINKDYSAKPWNRASHFSEFIKPKLNMSLTLKDHRFNRLFDCALSVLYHLDDISEYLDKFSSIVNGITILDRSFVEMEILKPILTAISLLGIHVTRPFHSLLLDEKTTYSSLLDAFKALNSDLKDTDPHKLLSTEKVLSFTSSSVFHNSLPKKCLLENLKSIINEYQEPIADILKIALGMFADGFAVQKGALFGFGPQALDTTGTKLKISTASPCIKRKLDSGYVPLHNLAEERNVGLTNYELDIRGKKNLESVSKKIVLNRSIDLIENADDFRAYRKTASIIHDMRKEWEEKMQSLQKDSYALREAEMSKREATILKDTEFLKKQTSVGPFTSVEEVNEFMESCPESKQKNERMYREVRFHRMTSRRKKESDSVFRLKKQGKNLETDDYANNLKAYLEKTRQLKNITLTDLSGILSILKQSGEEKDETVSESTGAASQFTAGEHVAAFWREDDGGFKWYLGVVTEEAKDQEIVVSYYKRGNKAGTSWNYPEEAEVRKTLIDQILERKLKVAYHCYTVIRCSMLAEKAREIDCLLDSKVNSLNN